MTTYLPKELSEGLAQAHRLSARKAAKLRVEAGGHSYPVLRRWSAGFAVEADIVPPLRGYVDLFEGSRFLSNCLIIASAEANGEMQYEFKRATAARDKAPVDFQIAEDAPVALLGWSL